MNWFRTDENGRFVWPGYGENMRVLKWMLDRIDGKAGGVEHMFGVTPRYEDINWESLEFSQEQYAKITSIDKSAWQAELALHAELFEKLKYHLPTALLETKAQLEKRLAA